MKIIIRNIVLGSAFMLSGQACTDLTETPYDVIPTNQFGNTPEQQAALLGPLYSSLGDYFGRYAELNTTTDEQVIPTRGGDWKDGDAWKRLKQHSWTPAGDDDKFNGMWSWCYNSITSINQQLGKITDKGTLAELRALRAFYHYVALDHFRNIIIADKIGGESPVQKTGAESFAWIEKELKEVYPDLSETVGGAYYGRFNKYVADMLLAKLYLNAEVWTGTAKWAEAKAECDKVIGSNKYQLSADFFSNFSTQNQNSKENILAVPYDASKRGGFNMNMRTLHYLSQLTYNTPQAPWNGYCTATEFYNSFAENDDRKKMWIVGQQYSAAGVALKDDGVPMAFTPEIPAFEMPAGPVARLAGARSQKYEIQRNGSSNDQDNDFVIFRLGDAYLMRAEASLRLGKTADAIKDVNVIRARAGATPVTKLTLDDMLAERGWEMAWEYVRRQDLIRFGQFTKAWKFKEASPAFRNIFPIPATQLALNPNLKQNPGY
ncbi:MAG: RagB/SusD family nutrient uptake outer membrane protein [Dyadobacter sp. 50-39]|uniref:RagB/SusD family nutrient uptake outer membrane protein n=1 Tax=Dyadobacter sp. 50-39 TaxID=1895756 RepID=UPI00095D5C02|nr:RagB/SusD family nutrient uptake outer membrane protein [Dyadobacter sp. 50-39]OJV18303.1 MAG: RagB/SusD family nutrient uptake outer membrane protein [Dyadobacter sp. 50-39]